METGHKSGHNRAQTRTLLLEIGHNISIKNSDRGVLLTILGGAPVYLLSICKVCGDTVEILPCVRICDDVCV